MSLQKIFQRIHLVAQDTISSLEIEICFLKRDQLKDYFKVI